MSVTHTFPCLPRRVKGVCEGIVAFKSGVVSCVAVWFHVLRLGFRAGNLSSRMEDGRILQCTTCLRLPHESID
jgi:hypothetical protein